MIPLGMIGTILYQSCILVGAQNAIRLIDLISSTISIGEALSAILLSSDIQLVVIDPVARQICTQIEGEVQNKVVIR